MKLSNKTIKTPKWKQKYESKYSKLKNKDSRFILQSIDIFENSSPNCEVYSDNNIRTMIVINEPALYYSLDYSL